MFFLLSLGIFLCNDEDSIFYLKRFATEILYSMFVKKTLKKSNNTQVKVCFFYIKILIFLFLNAIYAFNDSLHLTLIFLVKLFIPIISTYLQLVGQYWYFCIARYLCFGWIANISGNCDWGWVENCIRKM